MGVERGVATRMAQVVWPMMIVTVTNFEGRNSEILVKNVHGLICTEYLLLIVNAF